MKYYLSLFILAFSFYLMAEDTIMLVNQQVLAVDIKTISSSEVTYKDPTMPDGPDFIIDKNEIASIKFRNGVVHKYNITQDAISKELTNQQNVNKSARDASSLNRDKAGEIYGIEIARVEQFAGVCVFSDCTPLAKYEVLGDITFNSSGEEALIMMPGTVMYAGAETPQYTEIRNGLVSQSVLANRQVEGVLITITKSGQGKATMIKFIDSSEDKTLAKANLHSGVLVFTDCKPLNSYSFLGKVSGNGGFNTDYNILRDRMVKRSVKKYSKVQGIIPHFVTGGKDTAEAIMF